MAYVLEKGTSSMSAINLSHLLSLPYGYQLKTYMDL